MGRGCEGWGGSLKLGVGWISVLMHDLWLVRHFASLIPFPSAERIHMMQ